MRPSRIDDNQDYSALAQVEGTNDAAPLLIDPVTGALLVDLTIVSEPTSILPKLKFDDNYVESSSAYNGTDPVPLLIDSRNGYLLVDLIPA